MLLDNRAATRHPRKHKGNLPLGFDITVADVDGCVVEVVDRPEHLVGEELDEDDRHVLLVLGEMPAEAVPGLLLCWSVEVGICGESFQLKPHPAP